MAALNRLEDSLANIFKSTPKLSDGARDSFVRILPVVSLVIGVLSLLAAHSLWKWAHVANAYADYANSVSQAFGGGTVVSNRLTSGIWLSLIVLVASGVLYLWAYPALQKRRKAGWNLVLYGLLLNFIYGLLVLFTDYGGGGSFIGTLIGTIIGLWLLFQVRPKYKA